MFKSVADTCTRKATGNCSWNRRDCSTVRRILQINPSCSDRSSNVPIPFLLTMVNRVWPFYGLPHDLRRTDVIQISGISTFYRKGNHRNRKFQETPPAREPPQPALPPMAFLPCGIHPWYIPYQGCSIQRCSGYVYGWMQSTAVALPILADDHRLRLDSDCTACTAWRTVPPLLHRCVCHSPCLP